MLSLYWKEDVSTWQTLAGRRMTSDRRQTRRTDTAGPCSRYRRARTIVRRNRLRRRRDRRRRRGL